MRFVVYETTNLVNGKVYRGAHACSHENCCYLGSGKIFKKALIKYGSSNFERKVLRECFSLEEMFEAEKELVTEEWVKNPNTYNLKIGGEGGWDYINSNKVRWNAEKKEQHSAKMIERRRMGLWGPKSPTRGMLGKQQSEESRKKISENNALKLSQETIRLRLQDAVKFEYPKRGSVKSLSEHWNISHTQVRRFLNEHL